MSSSRVQSPKFGMGKVFIAREREHAEKPGERNTYCKSRWKSWRWQLGCFPLVCSLWAQR